jgi:hypothetical protein
MRTVLPTLVLIISASLPHLAQTAAAPQASSPSKSAGTAAASVEPTAVIHTTAGDLHCTFSKNCP